MAVTFRQTRRTASILLIFVNNFLNGLEYSIILPSLWKYLRSQGTTTELFFGIVVSSFNFAATLSGILAGCCADETGRAKKITILFSLFQVTGNLLYFVGGSPGVLLLSRLVAGFGAGSMTALYSEINRSTTPKERTPLLTGIFLMYHFSILLGPAINKALYSIHGRFGNFWVHGENAGGLVLGIAWAVYFVVFTLIFSNDLPALAAPDPATLIEIDESEKTRLLSNSREHSERSSLALQRHVPYGAATNLNDVHRTSAEGYSRLTASAPQLNVEDDTTPSWSSMENSDTAVDDLAMLMVRSCDVMVNSSKENNSHLKPPDNGDQHTSSLTLPRVKTAAPAVHMTPYFTPKSHHRHGRRRSGARGRGSSRAKRRRDKGCAGALTDEVLIALLFLQTVTMFVDTMIETTIPPTLERFFGYGPVGNSLLFMAISLGTLFIFVLLTIMSSWIPDLAIAVFGSLFMLVLVAGLLVLSTYYGTVESSVLFFAVYVALVVLCFTSSAAVAISTMTLMTKAIPFERQGKALKFRRAATFVGVVLGPLWAGGLMLRPVYMLGSGVAMIFVAFCITTLSVRTILARLGRPAG